MRVVIDALPLLIRSDGVKNYLYYWIAHRRRAAGSGTIGTFPALGDLGPLRHQASVAGPWRTATGVAQLALANHTPLPIPDLLTRDVDIFHASVMVRRPPRRPLLTAAATVFAYPSLYEGFGFPVAQAMAAGVPVVTSNGSALPEIAGDAALTVDPRSQTELRDRPARLLFPPELRADLAARGRARAATRAGQPAP
jgi:hypothetical protein